MKVGSEPQGVTAAAVRSIVLDQGEDRSRSSVRIDDKQFLRAFLRFMTGRGCCASGRCFLRCVRGADAGFRPSQKTIPASTIRRSRRVLRHRHLG